jgi:hypothetical protein
MEIDHDGLLERSWKPKDTPRNISIGLGRSWQMLGVITPLHISNV